MAHECDCGRIYQNLDALMACQNANHGVPIKDADGWICSSSPAEIWNDAIEACAAAALGVQGTRSQTDLQNQIVAAIRRLTSA